MDSSNKAGAFRKIVIHSSKVGSTNIDKISLMKIPDVNAKTSLEYDVEILTKHKEIVNKKKKKSKCCKPFISGQFDEIDQDSVNSLKMDMEEDGKHITKVKGDIPDCTSFKTEKRKKKLSAVSKPAPIKIFKMETDSVYDQQIKEGFHVLKHRAKGANNLMKQAKNSCSESKGEMEKKHEGKRQGKSSQPNGEHIKPLTAEIKLQENGKISLTSRSAVSESVIDASSVKVSKLKRNKRLSIHSKTRGSFILEKSKQSPNQNFSSKVKMEVLDQSKTKEENTVSIAKHQKTVKQEKEELEVCKDEKMSASKCSHHKIDCTYENQEIKRELTKMDSPLKGKRTQNSKRRKLSIAQPHNGRQISGRNTVPVSDPNIEGNSTVVSESISNEMKKKKAKNRKRISEAKTTVQTVIKSKLKIPKQNNKNKKDRGICLRRSKRLSLLPEVCYREITR